MFFSNDEISFELLGVFKINRSAFKRNSRNYRVYDSISLRTKGKGRFDFSGESLTVERGELLYLPMNAKYTQSTKGETVIAVHFINYSYNDKHKVEKISMENVDEIEEILLNMYRIWTEKKQGYKYKCISLFYNLLYLTNKQTHINSLYTQNMDLSVKKAVDYIHKNFRHKEINVTELAEMSTISEDYFRKIFKRIFSISPKQYIINLRLEYAAQLLQSQLYSVLEVSEKAGFNDVKYFGRIFKNRYGITPAKYRFVDVEKRFG